MRKYLLGNSFFLRYKISFIFSLLAFWCFAQNSINYPLVRSAQVVTVNHQLPSGAIANDAPLIAKFSKEPTDKEIFNAHFFEEPLVPSKGIDSSNENTDLVFALTSFSQRKDLKDFSEIRQFLKSYPESRWKGSLLLNIGLVERRTGYYNKALQDWQTAWNILKTKKDLSIESIADKTLSELLLINAWVGRKNAIDTLLKETSDRKFSGPSEVRISTVKEALWVMKNKPEISFKCGPYALNSILNKIDSAHGPNKLLMEAKSTDIGFSLTQLFNLSKSLGWHYQMAFRKAGAPIIVKAIVNWKLGHYSALIKKDSISNELMCEDATMGTTYGQQFWLSADALDSSASGYFLVPDTTLPAGWRTVGEAEGNKVFGKGQEPPDPGKNDGDDNIQSCAGNSNSNQQTTDAQNAPEDSSSQGCSSSTSCGMPRSNVHLSIVALHIFDTPLFYTPPKGPKLYWTVSYHQRDSYQPANFSYSNFGYKWTPLWLSYIQDDPTNLSANADVYLMDGGVNTFTSFNTTTQSYAPELETDDVLVRTCSTGCYEIHHPDGSKDIYSRPDGSSVSGRKVFLTQKIDPYGNAVKLSYDNNLRIVALTDALGQVTTIKYENSSDIYKITSVIDPFGRKASFSYDSYGHLIKITDMIGMSSTFQYEGSDFIDAMTTPYGTTNFTNTEGNGTTRAIEIKYPLGERERVEFRDNAPGINNDAANTVPVGMPTGNEYLVYRNTFYWNKKQMADAPGDYTKATIYHFLHGSSASGESGFTSPIIESIKRPLENRVWYNYQGQSSPIFANQGMSASPAFIGRVLDDGSTQLTKFTYNILGAVTSSADAAGRKFTYKYDSTNINLIEARQTRGSASELLFSATYNKQYLPLTVTNASGLKTTNTYNSNGELLTIVNSEKQKTTLSYDANGYLKSITGPVAGAVVSFTYDGYGRVRTVTDPEGYTVTTDYDALNRPTIITYPDKTYEQFVYDRMDAVHKKDRMGRWSHNIYDSLDRINVMQDALGRITQFIWCGCGSVAEIVDPLKQVTSFVRDLEGRITSKIYNDGKTVSYKYETTTSRLKSVTDAKSQVTNYTYNIDDNLKQVIYTNAVISTPSVLFAYDTSYNRVDSMTDGTGLTVYKYNPVNAHLGAGLLLSVDGPLNNDIVTYKYDSLDRISGKLINNVASSGIYDSLGRIVSASNVLGKFVYAYVDQTERLKSVALPNGQTTAYTYYNNVGDQRLEEILNKTSGGIVLSKFDYQYNAESQITKWTQQLGSSASKYYELGYDLSDQLISATLKDQGTSTVLKRYGYQYDKAGNRTSEQIDNAVTSAKYNNVNQLTTQQSGGPMHFKGSLSEFASVKILNKTTLDSITAVVDTNNLYDAFVKVTPGTNNISVAATDYSGNNNTSIKNSSITVANGSGNTLTFDANGNTTTETNPAVTHGWDAADRLVKITNGSNITEFVYDGLSRRVAEKLNGTVIKRWLWCGNEMCEERDASGGTVTKRFFPQGEQIGSTNYYFTFDHLGSIREMTDSKDSVRARYDYDPYGRRTKISGTVDADFGFSGHYYHTSSGLYLTLYRAYDAKLGRWLNRDPSEESEGINLYVYVNSNPINLIDFFGLADITVTRISQTPNSTISTFKTDDGKVGGYIMEPPGPSTTENGLDRRIPAGTYSISPFSGQEWENVYVLYNEDVPKSRGILLHPGNYPKDTKGCLMPGSSTKPDFVGGSQQKTGELYDFIENHINKDGLRIIIVDPK